MLKLAGRFPVAVRSGVCLSIAFLCGGLTAFSSGASPPNPEWIPSTDQTIVIDGVVDEAAWDHAWSTELPVEFSPGENTEAPV